MARCARLDAGGQCYHVLNRAAGRMQIFEKPQDYLLFLRLLRDTQELTPMDIVAYAVMPNHWHLVLRPREDGDLGTFMHRLTNAHTRKVHAITQTTGTGPLYQGRYKSFLVDSDEYLMTVVRYVERNPVRAGLTKRVEDWRWGSAWLRVHGTSEQKKMLAQNILELPSAYATWINSAENEQTVAAIRNSVNKGAPLGHDSWVAHMVDTYGLETTVRPRGRPMVKN